MSNNPDNRPPGASDPDWQDEILTTLHSIMAQLTTLRNRVDLQGSTIAKHALLLEQRQAAVPARALLHGRATLPPNGRAALPSPPPPVAAHRLLGRFPASDTGNITNKLAVADPIFVRREQQHHRPAHLEFIRSVKSKTDGGVQGGGCLGVPRHHGLGHRRRQARGEDVGVGVAPSRRLARALPLRPAAPPRQAGPAPVGRAAAERQQPGDADEEALVVVAAADGDAAHGRGVPERERLGGEVVHAVGPVAIGHLIEAGARGVAARRGVEVPAARGGAGDGRVRGGDRRVEHRVRLLVAVGAGLALHPRHVAPGVQHHVQLPRRGAEADARDVFPAALLPTPKLMTPSPSSPAPSPRTAWDPGGGGTFAQP
jgi:hypothetical protein